MNIIDSSDTDCIVDGILLINDDTLKSVNPPILRILTFVLFLLVWPFAMSYLFFILFTCSGKIVSVR